MAYDKEAFKVRYGDLSTSLQNQITNMGNTSISNTIGILISQESNLIGDITITIGPAITRPANPVNNANININIATNIVEIYHDDKWNGRTAVFM